MPTVLLVRHGRTTANASGVLAGWAPDVALDEVGQDQASALGVRLHTAGMPLARLVSSPLPRCLQTAQLLAAQLPAPEGERGIPIETDERLGECRYGAWTGRPLKDLAAEALWRTVQDQPSAAVFPDGEAFPGESLAGMSARAIAAIRELDREVESAHGAHAVWLAVSHGDVIKAVLADALGLHLDQFQRIHVDPASVSVVTYTSRRPAVVRVNDVVGPLVGLVPAPPRPAEGEGEGHSEGALPGDAEVGGGAGAANPTGSAG